MLKFNLFNKQSTVRACCFHFGRCGSTLLANMAASHPKIAWHGEVLHEYHQSKSKTGDPWRLIFRPLEDCRFRVFGFETKFQHLDQNGLDIGFADFIQRLREHDFEKFIILRRENMLRQVVSIARGRQTGQWHFKTTDNRPPPIGVRLDLERVFLGGKPRPLLDCFKFAEDRYQEATTILDSTDPLLLTYESDLQNWPAEGMTRLAEFLGVRNHRPTTDLQKIEARPLAEILENFEEVASVLAGTQFEWMLESKS